MKKIKITHLISAGGIGGGEKYLLIFAKYLDRERFILDFIIPEKGPLYDKITALGYSPKIIDINKSLISLSILLCLKKHLENSGTQIVHTHGARANFYGRISSLLAGTPAIISTVHNSIKDYPVSAMKKSIYMAIERITSSKVSAIATVSDYLKESLIKDYKIPYKKIETIYPAVDFTTLNASQSIAETRKSLSIPESAIVVGQAGRMTAQKGFEYFIDAARQISAEFDDTYFLFAGGGPEREKLEDKCRDNGIDERCIFCGFREDIGNIMQAIDILVSPSLSEGFPITILEAAYYEKPVIAAKVSGIPEFIVHNVNGILVPPGDSNSLANAIKSLIKDESQRHLLGVEAKKSVSRQFSPDYMLDRFSEIYGRVMSKTSIREKD